MRVLPQSIGNRIARGVSRRAAARFAPRLVTMSNAKPIVSITFDDCPQSAIRHGAQLLQSHGARGTFYVSGGLAGRTWENGSQFSADDVTNALAAGHEVGCHTFGHPDCALLSAAQIRAELDANQAYLAQVAHGYRAATFAFPYGSVSFTAKRAIKDRFLACRGVQTGVNAVTADMDELKSVAFPHAENDGSWVLPWLARATADNGWLILYSHDVVADPTPFGCTPTTLDNTIRTILAAGIEIVPVATAARRVTSGPSTKTAQTAAS